MNIPPHRPFRSAAASKTDTPSAVPSDPAKGTQKSEESGRKPAASPAQGGGEPDELALRFQALRDSMPRPAGRQGASATPPPNGGYLSKLQDKHYGTAPSKAGNASSSQAPESPAPWNFPFDTPDSTAGSHGPAAGKLPDHGHASGAAAGAASSSHAAGSTTPWNFPFDSPDPSTGSHSGQGGHAPAGGQKPEGGNQPEAAAHAEGGSANPEEGGSQGLSNRKKLLVGAGVAAVAFLAMRQLGKDGTVEVEGKGSVDP